MKVLRTVAQLRAWRAEYMRSGVPVGLVPTMGALHAGHLGLVRRSVAENTASVISIFVNPSQFAPSEDLDTYPRTWEADLAQLDRETQSSEAVVFAPTVAEMYPSGISLERTKQLGAFVEVLGCSHQLEGAVRPHFFRGVSTIVAKLFNAVQPTRAYFGQKDIQQTVVVRRMVSDLLMPVDVVVVPIAREPSGLAMSSRNEYLQPDTRQRASILYRALEAGREAWLNNGRDVQVAVIESAVRQVLAQDPEVVTTVEYVSVNDLDMFSNHPRALPGMVLSAAINLHNHGRPVRILDNIILE